MWVLLLVGGCASESTGACPGGAPALEDCALGVYHADCGGDLAPVFACGETTGACRWFTGGCVAAGHVVSDCPIEDRCCHESEDGPWPFASGWTPPAGAYLAPATRLMTDLDVIGATPIDATGPANLSVTVDPSITPPARIEVTCEGELGAHARMCATPAFLVAQVYARAHDTFALEVTPSIFGPTLLVEVLDGGALGRVFPGYQTDAEPPTLPATCEGFDRAGELTGGTLRIDRLDPGAHGELVVEAEEGGTITVRF